MFMHLLKASTSLESLHPPPFSLPEERGGNSSLESFDETRKPRILSNSRKLDQSRPRGFVETSRDSLKLEIQDSSSLSEVREVYRVTIAAGLFHDTALSRLSVGTFRTVTSIRL